MGKRLFVVALVIAWVAALSGGCDRGKDASGSSSPPAAAVSKSANATKGKTSFALHCTSCHGPDARGIAGVGKSLVGNEYMKRTNENDLVAMIIAGRSPSDPANTTGLLMPPKGGNSSLSEGDIRDIVAFLRTLP